MNLEQGNTLFNNQLKSFKIKALNTNGVGVSFYFIAKAFSVQWLYMLALVFIILALFYWIKYSLVLGKISNYQASFMKKYGKMVFSIFASLLFMGSIFYKLNWIA